jgi:hypothetical protein
VATVILWIWKPLFTWEIRRSLFLELLFDGRSGNVRVFAMNGGVQKPLLSEIVIPHVFSYRHHEDQYEFFSSFWVLVLLFAISPIAWLVMALRARNTGIGLCPTCGYDLRSSPERCRECEIANPRAA